MRCAQSFNLPRIRHTVQIFYNLVQLPNVCLQESGAPTSSLISEADLAGLASNLEIETG